MFDTKFYAIKSAIEDIFDGATDGERLEAVLAWCSITGRDEVEFDKIASDISFYLRNFCSCEIVDGKIILDATDSLVELFGTRVLDKPAQIIELIG